MATPLIARTLIDAQNAPLAQRVRDDYETLGEQLARRDIDI